MFKSLLLGLLSVAVWGQAATQYEIQEILPPDNATELVSIALNDRGQLLGQGHTEEGSFQFIWDQENGLRRLSPLLQATDMNDQGVLVGVVKLKSGGSRPTVWNPATGEAHMIWDVPEQAWPIAINNRKRVLLLSAQNEAWSFYVWDEHDGSLRVSAQPAGVWPSDFNDLGQILFSGGEVGHTFVVWRDGSPVRDIAAPEGTWAFASAFNNRGDLVGSLGCLSGVQCQNSGARVWMGDGREIQFGRRGERIGLLAINDQGQAVGTMSNQRIGPSSAIIWDEASGLVSLNDCIDPDSGWRLGTALAINAQGQIVAMGTAHSEGVQTKEFRYHRLVLLTPTSP